MIMILMMAADGKIEEDEVSAIQAIYEQIADSTLTSAQIRKEASELASQGRELMGFLSELAPYLNEDGKELVLKAAILVATVDQNLHMKEKELIASIGKALGMTPTHIMGVFNELSSSS